MRIAYLDCFSGISGDMFLGALVDAGVPTKVFEEAVAGLNIGAELRILRAIRSGISATKVDVYVHGEKDRPREIHSPAEQHSGHAHSEQHLHGSHPTPVSHTHEHSHGHHRALNEIREIIQRANLSDSAKRRAIATFERLGAAEAKIHSTDIDSVHFHEVGAEDAIVDIVCAAIGVEALRVEEIICSPLNVGSGTVRCAHGVFPVPAPATLDLLKDAPIYSSGIEVELVTPTGAAIVKTVATRFAAFPLMSAEKIGYGAGTHDFPGHPNVLRIVLGDAESRVSRGAGSETITVLEANLDDLNPQVFGYVMDRLLEQGALDVFCIPVQMKKNRPGMLLTVLCHPEDEKTLADLIFAETSTLGIRHRQESRTVLARKLLPVSTPWGEVRIKVASMNGTVTNYAPEYEDCRRIAAQHQVPLKTVMHEALRLYSENLSR